MMLSDPPRDVANGWSVRYLTASSVQAQKQNKQYGRKTHFSSPALTFPPSTSTTPTNRSTLPSLPASARISANCASNSGKRARNASPVGIPSSAGGMRDAVCTAAKDWSKGRRVAVRESEEMVRVRIVSFRATSKPFRSSAGWGSWLY